MRLGDTPAPLVRISQGVYSDAMSKTFTYVGGPKDKQTSQAEEANFPEAHDGGEYQWSGIAYSQFGAGDPNGPLPEANRAVVVWHPNDKN